jgi:hypothetical protein
VREHRDSIREGAPPDTHHRRPACPAPSHHVGRWKAMVMARKRRAPNYTGALAQPIYLEDHYKLTGPLGQPIQETDVAAIGKRAVEKMRLLFEHYKIDPSDEQSWQKLAESLAFAHVPGLQFAKRPKRGRKPTWKTGLGDEWVRAVDDVKSRTGKRTGDAIAELKKEPGGMWEKYDPKSLAARYRESKRRQKVLASLREAWLNEIATAISSCRPSATPPPQGGTKAVGPTKISVRAKTSRRK